MAAARRILNSEIQRNLNVFNSLRSLQFACKYATAASLPENAKGRIRKCQSSELNNLSRYAKTYPEFLPDPEPKYRQLLREKLERSDMIARRKIVNIPEFYVGSIMAVTIADKHAPEKNSRFVGICINRTGCGLRAQFVLRNIVDNQGIEIIYDLYDPTIQNIECLRLEKRLDDTLFYLRDAPNEYSTFPFDMERDYLQDNYEVPLNKLVVPLKPRPYTMNWENKNLKGVTNLDIGYKRRIKMEKNAKPWEEYDLMKIYRETIPDEDRLQIFREVHKDLDLLEKDRNKQIRSLLLKQSNKK